MPLVEAQGSVLIVRDGQRFTPLPTRKASRRGKIKTFSANSRRRLIEFAARLNIANVRTSFLTLTFAGIPTPKEAKRAFKQFTMRLRRDHPGASGVWRLEPQERRSPHFHVMLFNLPYIPQAALQTSWQECTREPLSILHIELIRHGKREVMSYVSKYIAKRLDASLTSLDKPPYQHNERDFTDDPGRFWGYINRACLPYAVRRQIQFGDRLALEELWSWMHLATHGRIGDYRHNARCYSDDVYLLIDRLSLVASCIDADVTHQDGSRIPL